MEYFILGVFSLSLLICIIFNINILYSLCFGFVLFFSYGLYRKYSFKEMINMSLKGIKTVKNILIIFMFIGSLTALWRASGTIAVIIDYCSFMMKPSIFLLITFLLNSLISFLTGTSFGTVATIGVICMTMGTTMNINPLLMGGSIISGIFFGDRCSPVSTSALLVSEITQTNIYTNIKYMMKYALVPFIISSIIYLILGTINAYSIVSYDIHTLFSKGFVLHYVALLPAIVVVVMSILKAKVRTTLGVSIIAAIGVCYYVQHYPIIEIIDYMINGYRSTVPDINNLLNGGGVFSMLKVACIITISSSYSGIFEGTHMFDNLKEKIAKINRFCPSFLGILIVSTITAAISCNQTLAIMLTNQLCEKLEPDNQKRAIDIEDAPVVIAPLIPWSIAGVVPVSVIGASQFCLIFAFYLYLIPICHLIFDYINYRKA